MTSWVKTILLFLLLGLFASGAYMAHQRWGRQKSLPPGLVQASGRVEGDHILVAAKFTGRVAEMKAREGDEVETGRVLVRLEETQALTRVEQARSSLEALRADVRSAETALGTLQKEVPLNIRIAEEDLIGAQAHLVKAKASKEQAERDAARYETLAARGIVEAHKAEIANLALTSAISEWRSAATLLGAARKRLAQARLGREKIPGARADLEALRARHGLAAAVLAEAESVLSDLTVRAPARGVIMTRLVDVGEMVAAGGPLFDLVDMDRLYLKVYVPEVQIGKVRSGMEARIYTDCFPESFYTGRVRYISSSAQFTPKEVQTRDERVKLVYEVRIYLDGNPDHCLTPGMPADAVMRWKEDEPWAGPVW